MINQGGSTFTQLLPPFDTGNIMPKKYYEFKKYKENQKKVEKFLKTVDRKAKHLKNSSPKKSHKAKPFSSVKTPNKAPNENITLSDIITTIKVVSALFVLLFMGILILKTGFKGFIVFICIGIFIVCLIYLSKKLYTTFQKRYLQNLLLKIEKYQDIANNSNDVIQVKQNVDKLLSVMDEIISYDEQTLRQAGLTKSTMPQQKQWILQHYDIILEQATERQNNAK